MYPEILDSTTRLVAVGKVGGENERRPKPTLRRFCSHPSPSTMATSSGKLALVLLKGSSLTQPGQKAPLVAKKVITRRAYHSSAITRVDATVHSFGRLIKAAVSDKESKKKASTKDNFAKVGDEEQMNTETLINEKRGESDRFIESEKEEVRTNLGSRQDGLFEMNIAKAKAAVDAAAVPAIDPMFSIRGQQKAYELHKLNPRT